MVSPPCLDNEENQEPRKRLFRLRKNPSLDRTIDEAATVVPSQATDKTE